MWRLRKAILIVVLCCLIVSVYQAQDSTTGETPERVTSVAFIEEGRRGLNSATTTNIGDDGITRFRDLFTSLDIEVESITLDAEIDEQYELLVLISPKRALSTQQTAYLWQFLQRGGHLLLALDPNGHNATRTEQSRNSGISQLLRAEYGISILDDLWIEPWFSIETLSSVITSWSEASAEDLHPHPITEPLLTYELPVRLWGGRSILVDSFTGISRTSALIYAESPYGETGRLNFQDADEEQLILNIGDDNQGRLLLGAIAENNDTGSRVALIGDGEIFQNLYGQTQVSVNNTAPRYPGNYIFTQRLIAWLLGIPESEWSPLPEEFTWLSMDGRVDEWSSELPKETDITFDTDVNGYDIQEVRAFHNDQFLYIAVETFADVPENAEISLEIAAGDASIIIILRQGRVFLVSDEGVPTPIDDASYATSTDVEIRLPLRIAGENPVIRAICMSDTVSSVQGCVDDVENGLSDDLDIASACVFGESSAQDCIDGTIFSNPVDTIDPLPVRFDNGPHAMVINIANLRTEPDIDSTLIIQLPIRALFSVAGRSDDSEWLLLRNGRYEGWVAQFLVSLNAEIEDLPIVSSDVVN